MRVTKWGHACVRLEKAGTSLVIDPGTLTLDPDVVTKVDAILVTHEHYDHLDVAKLESAVASSPDVQVFTCHSVAARLGHLGPRVRTVQEHDALDVGDFSITVHGCRHEYSHPDAEPVENVGFLVDGEVFHPGDALTVVDAPTLLLPGQAPWLTVPTMVAHLRSFAPQRAYAIHDGLVNESGLGVLDDVLSHERATTGREVGRCSAVNTLTCSAGVDPSARQGPWRWVSCARSRGMNFAGSPGGC